MMNYLQQNIGKLQAGGMPQTGIDPQMLAQMMSAQGAGQGVDYNGEPTPNVSGEPSFADMAQEIQERYDKLIIPLQRKLEKLKAKLKENPTDQTIKNEIRRLEERIDQLEQQEDMELQQLEAEVEKSGEMIDQQKQMEGYGDMQSEMSEEEMMSQQSPEMTEQLQGEMPMMQKGGNVPKEQIGTAIKDWLNEIGARFAAPFYESPRSNEHQTTVDDLKRELNQMDEEMPFASRAVRVLPPNAIAQGAIDMMSNDKDRLWEDALLGSAPFFLSQPLTYVLGTAGGIGSDIVIGSGLKATTGNDLPSHLKKLGLNDAASDFWGHMIQGAPGGFFGAKLGNFNTKIWRSNPKKKMPIGIEPEGIRLGNTIYGVDPNSLSMGFPRVTRTSSGTPSTTVASRMKQSTGMDWESIKKAAKRDLGVELGSEEANIAFEKAVNEGKYSVVTDRNGNKIFVERETGESPISSKTQQTTQKANETTKEEIPESTWEQEFKERWKRRGEIFEPFYKPYNQWHMRPWKKLENWPNNILKGINLGFDTALRGTSKTGMWTFDKLFPFYKGDFAGGVKFGKSFNDFFNQQGPQRWGVEYKVVEPNKWWGRNFQALKNIGVSMIPAAGALLYDNSNTNKEDKLLKNTIIIEQPEGFTTPIDTIVNGQSINDSVRSFGNKLIDTETGLPIKQIGGKIKKFQSPTSEQTKWLESFKKDYLQKHPTGLPGFLKETPYTEYGVWGNAIGKLLDNSGRMNIEAQNQFKHSNNPYTSVYDKMNREYNDQISTANKRYDLRENKIRRMMPSIEYGSLQQSQNARLAQQLLTNEQLSQNDTNRLSELSSLRNLTGKEVHEAYKNMMEQDYKNILLNENQRKSYLQSLDTYRKEKQGQFDQLVNMAAITGNRRKQIDMFNSELFPNFINAAINSVDLNNLLKLYQQHYPYYIPKQNV